MANIKISQLPSTQTVNADALVPVVQNGTTYSTSVSAINQANVTLSTAGDTYLNVGDVVKINENGYAASITANYNYNPTATGYSATNGSSSTNSLNQQRTAVCANDPSRVATVFSNSGSVYVKYGRYSNGTVAYSGMGDTISLANSYGPLDIDWNPFNNNQLIVLLTSGSSLQAYILTVNETDFVGMANSVYLANTNGQFSAFKYSKTSPNQFVAIYATQSNYLAAQAFSLTYAGFWSVMGGGEYIIDTQSPYTPFSYQCVLDTLDGTDTFGFTYNYYNNPTSSYVNKVVILTKSGTSLTIGSPYTALDTNSYPNAAAITFKLLSTNSFAATFTNNQYALVSYGQYSGTTVSYVSSPSSSSETNNGYFSLYFAPNSSVFGILYYSTSSSSIKMQFGYVANSVISLQGTETLITSNQAPDYLPLGFSFYPAGGFINYINGVAQFVFAFSGSNTFYIKGYSFVFIVKNFTNDNLFGVSQTSNGYGSPIQVLPFGNVNSALNTSINAGTMYYIQDNGTVGTTPTPSKYGLAISPSQVKTASYPTN